MNLLHEWEPIELEQALALLTGFFSLNDEYSHLRVANPATPEIIKKFKIITGGDRKDHFFALQGVDGITTFRSHSS